MNINRGEINEVPVTVTEMTTLSAPVYYLFEFKPRIGIPAYCIGTNTSTHTGRYDLFLIEETDSPDPLIGQVSLPSGDYTYTIYQQSSSTNLDPTNTTPAEFFDYVETGLLTVYGTEETITEYSTELSDTYYEKQ